MAVARGEAAGGGGSGSGSDLGASSGPRSGVGSVSHFVGLAMNRCIYCSNIAL